MGILTTRGSQNPPKLLVVFWGMVMGGIALVMLLLGSESALQGLQSLVIITAVPFAIIVLLLIIAWLRELSTDPRTLREKYADTALRNAIVTGVDKYDDDFELQVVPSAPGTGAGADVESTHADYTDWYRRTDEDGRPVGYGFETDTWADGWEPENAGDGTGGANAAPTDSDDTTAGDGGNGTRRGQS
ncbi:BCCT family transporter [Brachybacterium nesterenkovii]|nr:BCCT family transporter [Brachybacterium nesterenkovii]